MLLFQRKGKTVDNGAQNFEKLSDSIETLSLVCELEKDIVYGASDKRTEVKEFSVDAVKSGLKEVALTRVFRVKKLQQLEHEAMVDVCLGDVGVKVLALDEAKEELINDLNMWPGNLEDRLVLLRIKGLVGRGSWRTCQQLWDTWVL